MNRISSLSLLFSKLFLLSCFSFMGGMTVEATELPPCHQEQAPEQEEANCDACLEAAEAWSETTVLESDSPEIVLQTSYTIPDFIAAPIFTPKSLMLVFSSPDPPAIITKTIQLLL